MSIQPNPTTDMPASLKHLKETFEESFKGVSSAKDVKKMIDRLMKQFPLAKDGEQKLRNEFSQLDRYRKIEPSNILGEVDQIKEILHQLDEFLRKLAADADQDDSPALSTKERGIINQADEHKLVKRLRVSFNFFLRLDEPKPDPRICLFLAIFPAKAVLRKRFLIYWWIGEELVRNEEEGEKVFKELLNLDLLLPYRTDKCPRVSKCQIFPWIRCMLVSVAKKEKLLSLEADDIPCFDPTYSRRTCLIANHTTNLTSENESKLETIFNVNERYLDFQHQWLAKLKRLAVLQLGRWQVSPIHHIEVRDESFLAGLKTQKLLKYLSLRGISRISALPESIKELVSLEILDLKACHNLDTLPTAIASLRKLTHFDVSQCYLLESLPKGLDKLTSLQVLKGFIIGPSQKTLIRIEQIRSLTGLKRLSINIGSEATIQEKELDKLKDLKNLKCLKISWGKAVVEKYSVSFPPELQKLDLEGIPHETMPEWLKPSNLRKLETLYIKGGKLKNSFHEGEPWNVKYLVLKYTEEPQIKKETLESSMFPSLQYVKMVKWVQKGEQESIEYERNKD